MNRMTPIQDATGPAAAMLPLDDACAQTRVLIVEDTPAEAELMVHQLRTAGLPFSWQRVETEAALRGALAQFRPAVILSDFSLPQFDGLAALDIVHEHAPDIPFIFVSGTIGEERAIEALRRGASDYVLKTNLKRLASAVDRALNDARARKERRSIEQRLHDIVATAEDWIWELDAQRRFVFSSESVANTLGLSAQEVLGTDMLDHAHAADRAAVDLSMAQLGPTQRTAPRAAYRWKHRQGHYRWLERNVLALVDNDGRITGFRGADRDITQRREQEARITRLTRVLQMLSGINSLVPRIRDRKELLHEACRVSVKTGGYTHALVMLQRNSEKLVQPIAWAGVDESITDVLCTAISDAGANDDIAGHVLKTASVFVCNDLRETAAHTPTHAALLQAGCRSVVALPLTIDKTTIGVLLLAAQDAQTVSTHELRMLREVAANLSFALQYLQKDSTLRFLSYFNPQTGLAKRSLFCERLGRLLNKPTDRRHCRAVAVIDIEQLSVINDSFGRHTGDLLLQHVADRLRRHFHDGELLGQLEGGTFATLLEFPAHVQSPTAILLEIVGSLFGRPFELEGCELPVSVKSGTATYPSCGSDASTLLQNAEAALRAAKASGEKHLCYCAEQHSRIVARLGLEHKLRTALHQKQFELHYQPKVNVKTRCIEGVEALLRWRDPESGLVSPGAFIPLLESSGLIVDVGDWVLEHAALDCQHWREAGLPPVRIAVNISPVQLRRPDFLHRFTKLVGSWTSSNCGLDIEITEGALLDDSEAMLNKLERLRACGARIAIDDFGTGYSSLSRLADLAIDTLKIDRSFISRLRSDNRCGKALVHTIISLARALNLTVVAEGVETEEQLGLLWEMGCEQSQGYLHSEAVPADEMAHLLEHGKGRIVLPAEYGSYPSRQAKS